jgi:hypothetical protein
MDVRRKEKTSHALVGCFGCVVEELQAMQLQSIFGYQYKTCRDSSGIHSHIFFAEGVRRSESFLPRQR